MDHHINFTTRSDFRPQEKTDSVTWISYEQQPLSIPTSYSPTCSPFYECAKKRHVWIWRCCKCGLDNIPIANAGCPNCRSGRCAYCPTTKIQVRASGYQEYNTSLETSSTVQGMQRGVDIASCTSLEVASNRHVWDVEEIRQ